MLDSVCIVYRIYPLYPLRSALILRTIPQFKPIRSAELAAEMDGFVAEFQLLLTKTVVTVHTLQSLF